MSRNIIETIKSDDFREAIQFSKKYILSHHEEKDYDRCLMVSWKNRIIPLCARCTGIYVGIILGIFAIFFGINNSKWSIFLVGFLPIPMLIDWSVTSFHIWKSNNYNRVLTGVLCGFAYILGLITLITHFPRYDIIVIGFIYGIVAFLLLKLTNSV